MTSVPFRTTRRIQNLRPSRADWYRVVRNKATSTAPARVDIYDEIGFFGVSAQDFIRDLQGCDGDLEMHINSPGGDVFDGIAIYNALRQRDGDVSIVVDGLAASAASFIAQAASPGKLKMAPHSSMMIHDGFGMALGNAADMREMADLLDKTSDNIAGIYADRTGQPATYWREQMRAETWYSDQEAVDAGLADSVLGSENADQGWDLSVYDHAPHVRRTHNRDARVEDSSGDSSSWDGPAAMSAAAHSDDPAKAYAAICAGRKEGDPSKQSSWALPHHKAPGDPPNAAGVRDALGRLPQTHDLTNAEAAKSHLQAHMKAINPDYDAEGASDEADVSVMAELLRSAFQEGIRK